MARRNVGSLLSGFAAGYDMAGQMLRDRDLRKVAEEQETETMGSPIEGDQAAVQAQLDSGAGMGEARRLASSGVTPSTHSFMGQSQATPFSDEQKSSARRLAQAGVLEKHGDFDAGGRIRNQVATEGDARKRGAREDMRFAWEEGDRRRVEAERQREDAYKAERESVFKGSSFFKRNQAFSEVRSKYEQDLAEYQRKVDAGDTSAVEPVAPVRPMQTVGESLLDRAESLAIEVKYGKASADSMMQFAQLQQQVLDDGYIKTLKLAQQGAPLTKVVETFNSSGQNKIDPSAIISDKLVDRPGGLKTRLIAFKRPDGSTMTIDTLADLDSLGKAGDLFDRAFKMADDRRADKQVQIAQGHLGIAQAAGARGAAADARAAEDHAAGAPERQLRQRVAGLQLDVVGDDPTKAAASSAKLAAVGKGVDTAKDQPAEVKLANALRRADPSLDAKTALKMAMTKKDESPEEVHRDFVKAITKEGMVKPAEAVKQADELMTSMGFTKQGKRWTMDDPAPAAKPASEADAHAQAKAAIAGGAPADAVNERLKKMGFKPL
jgi:hypothetical protein